MRRSNDGTHARLLRLAPIVAASVVLAFGALLATQEHQHAVVLGELEQAARIQTALGRVHAELRAIESSQRGYALTGDADYVQLFRESVDGLRVEFTRLQDAMAGDTAAVQALTELARQRVQISSDIVAARRDHGPDSAVAIVAGGRGRELMAAFSTRADRIVAEQETMRQAAAAAADRRAALLAWTIVLGSLSCAVVALGSSWIAGRYAASRDRAAAALAAANAHLREQAEELEAQAVELEVQTKELEEAAAEQQAQQERFRALVEHAGDMVMVLDDRRCITYVSPAAEHILGHAAESLIGRPVDELVHPDDFDRNIERVEAAEAGVMAREARYRHRDGTWRVLAGHATNLLRHPAVGGIVVNSRDVTEERRVAEQLRQSQKLEAVGLLASGIAHDFNNILTSIQGHAQLAVEDAHSPQKLHDDLDEIRRAAAMASALTRQLLAFSRQQVMRPEPLDLNDVVADSARMLQRMVGTHIEVVTTPGADDARVVADRTQVQQVLMNLVVNARDALPLGGRVVIGTDTVTLAGGDESDVEPGAYVRLSVSDNGCGMTADVLDRIFEPFFTTKDQGSGTGLGLSTCWGIVRQSGGHIRVQSEPDHGTTFTIYLPAATDAPAATPDVQPSRPQHAHGSGQTLLLVEDDVSVRRFSRRVLEAAGYTVIEAPNGSEALRSVENAAGAVSLIISDVLMPAMTGPVLARRVHERYPWIPVVLMSGHPQEQLSEDLPSHDGITFLEKPYTREELVQAVGRTLARRASA